jgi:DNA-binding IclR family transcriptional regulator
MACRSDSWRFLTNHAHVLACVAGEPDARLRDIAARVGITERAAHDLVRDLERAGYLRVRKVGRRNRYEVRGRFASRDAVAQRRAGGGLVALLAAELDQTLRSESRGEEEIR